VPAEELFSAPADLTLITNDDELRAIEAAGVAEFDRLDQLENVDPETLAYAMRVKDDLSRVRAELRVRDVRVQEQAALAQNKVAQQLAAARAEVHGTPAVEATTEAAPAPIDTEAIAAAAARGATSALATIMMDRRGGSVRPEEIKRRAVASLAETSELTPPSQVSEKRLAITASIDIPGVASGDGITSLASLTQVMQRKAKSIPATANGVGTEHVVATIRNDFSHTVDDRTKPQEMEELFRYLRREEAGYTAESLVAAGGWCAPSEIRYDFFNIACSSGLIDLPTFGVSRGGIQFPVSPSLADAMLAPFGTTLSNTSQPWLWTEADDIAALTGSPTKPCVRVPCPDFDEERLDCYGICLTAGNLTDEAYPEATQNFLRLLMAAHDHAINARLIALMVAASSAPITITGGAATDAAAPRIFNAAGLAAADYRERYGMCLDDVLEIVIPAWVREVIRADLAWKAGVELFEVTNAQIDSYFMARNVRPQWVDDWQVRGAGQFGGTTPMTAWPTTVDFLIYAAGTFVHGNGMTLDLGVIRDSVLNETNDFTAAFSEECHLVARVGHESRRYTVPFNVNGSTSALLTGTVRV
jgi:hypothetical protein